MHVSLRPPRPEDLALLQRLRSGAEEAGPFNWFGFRPSGIAVGEIERTSLLEPDGGLLVVEADGVAVGDVTWRSVAYGPTAGSACWNIGCGLAPEHRGRGIGTEAQRLLADYLFATTTVARVEASTDVGNHAEQRALEKAGFAREGILRRAQFRAGDWHDVILYSRVRGDDVGDAPRSAEAAVQRVGFVGVRTSAFAAMAGLVRDALGAEQVRGDPDACGFRLADGTTLEIYDAGADADHAFFGSAPVVGLVVGDYESAHAAVEAAGLRFIGPERGDGRARWHHFEAPDGNVWEIVEGTPTP